MLWRDVSLSHVTSCNCIQLNGVYVFAGIIVIQGRVPGVLLGRVAATGFSTEALVQGGDPGKLQQFVISG